MVDEDLVDHAFLAEHTIGFDGVAAAVAHVDVEEWSAIAGLDPALVRTVARRIGNATSVSIFEDLGVQQAPHSTLNSYLEKLLFLVTGNFGTQGGMNLHTAFMSLFGGGAGRSPVGGHRIISGMIPAAAIPGEILTDHPDRFRAMIVESGNPVHSLPDSQRMREALAALDFVLVIDLAMTETARCADYVLPAASQFEKWECTFFNLEFPRNDFHLRRPLFEPLAGTLPEPEIHSRLVRALGGYTDDDLAPLHEAAAQGRAAFAEAFFAAMATNPAIGRNPGLVLYETLGPVLGEGNQGAAALWGISNICFLTYPDSVQRAGFATPDELFDALLTGRGVTFTVDDYPETWNRIVHDDGRVHLVVPELLDELGSLPAGGPPVDDAFPFVLSAGERRASTANTIMRNPAWLKNDREGALRMHPADAARLGVTDGDRVAVETKRASAVATVETTDSMQEGHVSLPNGRGLSYPGDDGGDEVLGVAPNELTDEMDRDWLAGTPHHKHVRARISALVGAES